jgi:VanZ family protein
LRWLTAGRVKVVWFGYWIVLFGLMHTPKSRLPRVEIYQLDKVVHFLGYALLTAFGVVHARISGCLIDRHWTARWILISTLYAAFDELTQPIVNRSADGWDVVADLCGVATVLAGAKVLGFMPCEPQSPTREIQS